MLLLSDAFILFIPSFIHFVGCIVISCLKPERGKKTREHACAFNKSSMRSFLQKKKKKDGLVELTTRLDILSLTQVLDALLTEYEKSIQGPGKWKKLAVFLQQRFVQIFFCEVFFFVVESSGTGLFFHLFPKKICFC